MSGADLVRLNRLLAERGLAARRRCDELLRAGVVAVDGEVVREPGRRVRRDARIEVDGEPLRGGPRLYFALNKPKGVVCTSAPGEGRPRAVDLVRVRPGTRLYTVGRLDLESRGLVLLTNDGDFALRAAHPRYGVERTYWVRVRGRVGAAATQQIQKGVWLAEGKTAPARIHVRRRSRAFTTLLVTTREGKNREIRRAFAKVGFAVLELVRTRFGPVTIRGLRPGESRPLAGAEVRAFLGGGERS